jgi:DNA-binding transcriptional MerR regulator
MRFQGTYQNESNDSDFEKLLDQLYINDSEKFIFKTSFALGLTKENTREDLFNQALAGGLDEFTLDKIKEIQMYLKVEGNYEGEIDGLFGSESIASLKELSKNHLPIGTNYKVYSDLVLEKVEPRIDLSEQKESLKEIRELLGEAEMSKGELVLKSVYENSSELVEEIAEMFGSIIFHDKEDVEEECVETTKPSRGR